MNCRKIRLTSVSEFLVAVPDGVDPYDQIYHFVDGEANKHTVIRLDGEDTMDDLDISNAERAIIEMANTEGGF